MISAEELGNIISRLAIADEITLQQLLKAASMAGPGLLPDDTPKLNEWAKFVRAIRRATHSQTK